MAKSIVWSHKALAELKSILEFYNERNGSNAYSLKLLDKLQTTLNALSNNELIGRLASNKTSRVLVFGVYLIFYEIEANNIQILSFWNNRQDENKRLDNL